MLAVLAVSDKRNVEELATGLLGLGWNVVATDGTRAVLRERGITVRAVSELAGVPTLLGGRVKTLTVSLMGGILARDEPGDLAEVEQHGIQRVDLVCCNYYRLPEPQQNLPFERFRELIDVGGPAMLRAAAKNCAHVIPLSDPDDYAGVLKALAEGGVDGARRLSLARRAFDISAAYDAAVARLLAGAVDG
ncbi:MAG TPA: phosphoribosylaminoimidazolecarboxamide formyltransferase [Actinoplanes sp.]|nr:phosphoribosylaminoimidazolecarboxamide formyltransferase [Actinoplanes sp.]